MESKRRRLMEDRRRWGDIPQAANVATHTPSESELESLDCDDATDPTSVASRTLAMHARFTELEPQKRSKSCISSAGWTEEGLVNSGERFVRVPRISALLPQKELIEAIEKYDRSGEPLIIEDWHEHPKWPKDMLNVDWLRQYGQQEMTARNVHDWSDHPMPLGEFIEKSRSMPPAATSDETERLYGKDSKCPEEWASWLQESGMIPTSLLCYGNNDVLKYLPRPGQEEAVETLMCYLGIGDTFTPCHKDLCASSGQNLMCYTENGGSSFWFMTESKAVPEVSDYFHDLNQELDLETHVVTVEEFKRAPFKVYIAEQKLGDMVLVPPRSCHQVVNHGGLTVKTSWSRMTVRGLKAALYHELPIYRRVCRQETYRVKSTIHHTLRHFTTELEKMNLSSGQSRSQSRTSDNGSQPVRPDLLRRDIQDLLEMMDTIIAEEYSEQHSSISPLYPSDVRSPESESERVECDFCGCDIFLSYFECNQCGRDGLTLCASCYVEGRTCRCGDMKPAQIRPLSHLLDDRNKARQVLQDSDFSIQRTKSLPGDMVSALTTEILDKQILDVRQPAIFQAACELRALRISNNQHLKGVICYWGKHHTAPTGSALYCKKCHSSRCFSHILTHYGVHSSEALLFNRRGIGEADWHIRHQTSKKDFEASRDSMRQAEQRGERPNMRFRLAHAASSFMTCRPLQDRALSHGFYDEFRQPNLPLTSEKGVPIRIRDDIPCPSPLSSPEDDPVPLPALEDPGNPAIIRTKQRPLRGGARTSPRCSVVIGLSSFAEYKDQYRDMTSQANYQRAHNYQSVLGPGARLGPPRGRPRLADVSESQEIIAKKADNTRRLRSSRKRELSPAAASSRLSVRSSRGTGGNIPSTRKRRRLQNESDQSLATSSLPVPVPSIPERAPSRNAAASSDSTDIAAALNRSYLPEPSRRSGRQSLPTAVSPDITTTILSSTASSDTLYVREGSASTVPGFLSSDNGISSLVTSDAEWTIESLQSMIKSLQTEVQSLHLALTPLQSEVPSLQTEVTSLRSSVAPVQLEVPSLQMDVTSLQSIVNSLQSTVTSLQSIVTPLQSEVMSLRRMITTPQPAVTALQNRCRRYDVLLAELQEKYQRLESDAERRSRQLEERIDWDMQNFRRLLEDKDQQHYKFKEQTIDRERSLQKDVQDVRNRSEQMQTFRGSLYPAPANEVLIPVYMSPPRQASIALPASTYPILAMPSFTKPRNYYEPFQDRRRFMDSGGDHRPSYNRNIRPRNFNDGRKWFDSQPQFRRHDEGNKGGHGQRVWVERNNLSGQSKKEYRHDSSLHSSNFDKTGPSESADLQTRSLIPRGPKPGVIQRVDKQTSPGAASDHRRNDRSHEDNVVRVDRSPVVHERSSPASPDPQDWEDGYDQAFDRSQARIDERMSVDPQPRVGRSSSVGILPCRDSPYHDPWRDTAHN